MKVGFTGTQKGMTKKQRSACFGFLVGFYTSSTITEFHHGDCVGADAEVHRFVDEILRVTIIGHPPVNPSKRAFCKFSKCFEEKNYLERNRDIVDKTDFLVATPGNNKEVHRSGTWSTVRYAKKKRKEIVIIYPDGEIADEYKPKK